MLCGCKGAVPGFPLPFVAWREEMAYAAVSSPPSEFAFVQDGNGIAVILPTRLTIQSTCIFLPILRCFTEGIEVPQAGLNPKITSYEKRRCDPEVTLEDNWHMSRKNVVRDTEHPELEYNHWSGVLPSLSSSLKRILTCRWNKLSPYRA